MVIRKPLVVVGSGIAQLPDSDRLQYDIDLGGNKHYRGSVVPTNPNANDTWDEETSGGVWVRTWFWSGQYWLSNQEFWKDNSIVSLGATSILYYDLPVDANVLVNSFKVSILLGATNTTANYWTFALSRVTGVSTSVAIGAAISTAAVSPNQWYTATISPAAHINIASSGSKAFRVDATRVGTPSNIAGGIEISYRLARI